MNADTPQALSNLLNSMGIGMPSGSSRLIELLGAYRDDEGVLHFNFPTDLHEQQQLAHEWSKFTHLSEDKLLEVIQAMVVVLKKEQ